VRDHEVAIGILHLHEPVAHAGWLNVVATTESVVHATRYLGSQLSDERVGSRADEFRPEPGLGVEIGAGQVEKPAPFGHTEVGASNPPSAAG
jgi:hypothetical protein